MSSSSLVPPANTTSISGAVQSSTSGAASTALQQLSGNLDTFLQMLMTQLQNQDPTQPMDTAQFTQQLVEYSQVEQQIQTNQTLTTMNSSIKASATAAAVGLINQNVSVNGATQNLAQNGSVSWLYNLPEAASNVTLTVTDSNNNIVQTASGTTNAGTNSYNWNGINAQGNEATPGNYTLTVTAIDSNGNPIKASENPSGTVTGISFDSNGNPQVIIAGTAYAAANIVSINAQSTSSSTTP